MIEASFGTTAPFDELVVKVFNEQVIGVKGLQRQIDTLRRQMVEQQEAMRQDMNRELEALRAQIRMLTDKPGAKGELGFGVSELPPASFSA